MKNNAQTMKPGDIMAEAARVFFSGTTAAAEDTVREAWSVAAVMPRPVAIQRRVMVPEAMGAAAFRLLPEPEVLLAGQVRLAGP
jgi:hypothetical protein